MIWQHHFELVACLIVRNIWKQLTAALYMPNVSNFSVLPLHSEDTSTVQFHAIFAEDATQKFGDLVVDMVHVLAKSVLFEQRYRLDIGGVMVEPYSCRMNVYPVNYTDPQTTLFTTLTPTTQVVLPTAGICSHFTLINAHITLNDDIFSIGMLKRIFHIKFFIYFHETIDAFTTFYMYLCTVYLALSETRQFQSFFLLFFINYFYS